MPQYEMGSQIKGEKFNHTWNEQQYSNRREEIGGMLFEEVSRQLSLLKHLILKCIFLRLDEVEGLSSENASISVL